MTDLRTQDYASRHGLSNRLAKRRLRRSKSRETSVGMDAPIRGAPVAKTGRPKKGKK